MKILITGAKGFVGLNLVETLKTKENYELYLFDKQNSLEDLELMTRDCDFVVHLAGVNRPLNPQEFYEGNKDLTDNLCRFLQLNDNRAPILLSSSVQASKDNDYGKSKKLGEDVLFRHGETMDSPVYVYRFENLYGKWSRPFYNTVIATWCHQISRDEAITINDPNVEITFVYIDDVVREIINAIEGNPNIKDRYCYVETTDTVSIGEVADLLYSFKESRLNYQVPNIQSRFSKNLYSTYLSFLPEESFKYPLKMNVDHRGSFTEVLKSEIFGQVSVNVSKPGITKGQHWHHTKNEKFLVVSGEGEIHFRHIITNEIIKISVNGNTLEVVDIPVGYTHSIINTGDQDLVTLMWVNEIYDPNNPDTYFEEV